MNNKPTEDYEENWSIPRLLAGLAIIVILIGLWSLGSYGLAVFKDVEFQSRQCLAAADKEIIYMNAIATSNVDLCSQSNDPLICRAEISKDPTLCEQIPDSTYKDACIFAVTKDPSRCPYIPLLCQAESTGDEALCQQLPEALVTECIASLRKDPALFISSQQQNCREKAWQIVSIQRDNKFLCRMISDEDLQRSCQEGTPY